MSGETSGTSHHRPRRRAGRLLLAAGVALATLAAIVVLQLSDPREPVAAPVPTVPYVEPRVPTPAPSPEATDKARHKPKKKESKAAGASGCKLTSIAEPTCGALWGASLGQSDLPGLERSIGRRLDVVYKWHGVDQAAVPTDEEIAQVEQGRFVHVNIEARRFMEAGHPAIDYAQIAAGRYDASLAAQARRFAKLDRQAFVTFDHEADAKTRYNVRGSPARFVAAWRHVVEVYRRNGADNVVFVWNVTGWEGNFDKLPGLWPGNAFVDWLSWEGYNMSACRPNQDGPHSFDEAVRPMYSWVQSNGPRHGIDPGKPVMISEMGTTPIGAATDDWYRAVPGTLRKLPRIRAVKVWNSKVGPCDFRITTVPGTLGAFTTAGTDPYVNVDH
jgi:hypothetical protein